MVLEKNYIMPTVRFATQNIILGNYEILPFKWHQRNKDNFTASTAYRFMCLPWAVTGQNEIRPTTFGMNPNTKSVWWFLKRNMGEHTSLPSAFYICCLNLLQNMLITGKIAKPYVCQFARCYTALLQSRSTLLFLFRHYTTT